MSRWCGAILPQHSSQRSLALLLQVVCAGSLDTFQIFVWSVKTGRLLDILAAHEGPVVALAFSPTQAVLASVSWDRTLRTWDVFSGKGEIPRLISGEFGIPSGRLVIISI